MIYEHIGWMKEGNSDKVWGMIRLEESRRDGWSVYHPNKYLTFWGRRGAKLQTKIVECTYFEAGRMFDKKIFKGYKEVRLDRLEEVYPEFRSDLEKTAIWASLKI